VRGRCLRFLQYSDANHIQGYGLDVKINGTAARLMLDTGAGGILIDRKIADKARVSQIVQNNIHGLCDRGPAGGYIGSADSIEIGDLQFNDCRVEVMNSGSVIGRDGLIGGDVFAQFLVDIDSPDGKFRLSQLPPRPDEATPQAALDTGANPELNFHDRYVAPEMQSVYIQDVVLPEDMVTVLTHREIANQEIETFKKQRAAQEERIEMEQSKGTADMQAELARSKVGISIKKNNADARTAEAGGEAEYIRQTGTAKGAEVEAIGLARAKGFRAQVEALGPNATALVNVIAELAEGRAKFVPDILVTGGSNGGGALEGLAATAMRFLAADAAGRTASNGGDDEKVPTKPDLPPSSTTTAPKLGTRPIIPPKP
jgi:hypothetical protein